MPLYYLLIVVVSDVKVMSSIVAIIFAVINNSAITQVANNNIRTKPRFLNRTEPNSFRTASEFFKKPNRN